MSFLNFPLYRIIVPPVQKLLKKWFNLTDVQAFRYVLYIFYPGEYVLGSLLFLLTLFVIKQDLNHMQLLVNDSETSRSIVNPLNENEINKEIDENGQVYDNRTFLNDSIDNISSIDDKRSHD